MLSWVYFVGLTLDYYGDAEYMAYIKQDPNGTNPHLEPPGFNFTWEDTVRKFEHKKYYWSDTKQFIFCVAFWLGSVPAASMSYAILPNLVYSLEGTCHHLVILPLHTYVFTLRLKNKNNNNNNRHEKESNEQMETYSNVWFGSHCILHDGILRLDTESYGLGRRSEYSRKYQ